MKAVKPIKFLLLIFIFKSSFAQNLVPNPGFESYMICPSAQGELWLAYPWDTLNSSPDLFNECYLNSNYCFSVNVPDNFAGHANAHSGAGYAGFLATDNANNREYLQAGLVSPLIAGKIYKVEAWFRRASYSQFAVQALGMTLSSGPITQTGTLYIGFAPQVESQNVISDTSGWTLVQQFIIAAGGENNISIGNFREDAFSGITAVPNASALCPISGAYYFVDAVKVELINEQLSITGDTIICDGGITTLIANANTPVWWSVSGDPLTPVSTNLQLTVNPSVTSTFILNGIFYKDSVTVHVISPPVAELGNDTTICEENFVYLNAANFSSTYLWSTGETTSSIVAGESLLYWVEVNNGGCTVSDSINITVLGNPEIDLGADTVFCSLHSDFIMLDAGEGISYLWLPGNQTTQSITVTKPGTYSVIVIHANGCAKDTSTLITEICDPVVFVPASFTPNGDALNDILFTTGSSFTSFEFGIFNRYGELVFQTSDPSFGWDGTFKNRKMPMGLYIYFLKYSGTDESGNELSKKITGTITLIR